jgi:type IV pilus assembly protein PilW
VKRHEGFSLVELMVAITLALLLTGAVVSVFVGSRSAYESTAGVGDMSDSGRLALNLIGESVRSAGNLACNSAMSATSQTVVPGAPVTTFINSYGLGVEGFEANGTTPPAAIAQPALPVVGAANNWTPNLQGAMTGAIPAGPGQPVQGSDVLVIRSSVPRVSPVYTTADFAPNAAVLTVTQVPAASAGFEYAAVSDCTKSVIFKVAGMAAGATTVSLNAGLPGVGFSAGALVAPLTTTVYYIGTGSDGDSSLFRLEQVSNVVGFAAPEELVPDVENMQVLYGIDPTGTQTAAAYVPANQVAVGTNVVSIQVALLVASPAAGRQVPVAAPYNLLGTQLTVPADNRARQVFYATLNLRNAVN